jgi:hypothetical protein
VTATDFAASVLDQLVEGARTTGIVDRISTLVHRPI